MNEPGREAEQRELISRWVRDHGPSVLGYLTALVRDVHRAEDLLQDVFCRAWEARHRYTDQGRERAFLLTIADHLARDRARRPNREIQIGSNALSCSEPVSGEQPPWHSISEAETKRQVEIALRALTEPQRRTLLLRYYGDLDFAEIAEVLGSPLNTILSHNRRGLLALRQLLANKSEL